MAVTSIWPIKGRVDKVINYARNPEKTHDKERLSELHEIEGVVEYAADEMKTEKRAYVTCLNLHSEETAAQEFMETKRLMHNEGGRSCYHGYQSFKADEVDASTAHSIGVALAQELWGDRFQVVIATHCNTGHYHNHFVINSVSDVDGKKFYNSPADYRRMREVSDRLCREAKISVIEYPADRRVNYGEWLAEKNGKPTMRSRIREDIDRAILASTTEREFLRMMKEMGYEVITKTPKGSPRVHPIIRIVDGGKNFRLDKLGEYYELDSIPLPPRLLEALKEAKESSTSDYVIANKDGQPLTYTQLERLWTYITTRTARPRKAKKLVGGKYVKYTIYPVLGEKARNNGKVVYSLDFEVTPHQLRHTYITNLIFASVDPKTVQYLAGHENSKITMDIYAKAKYNRPKDVAPMLEHVFNQWNEATTK